MMRVGGLSLWGRSSGGDWIPVAYHPVGSLTWRWAIYVNRSGYRWFQWYRDDWRLTGNWTLTLFGLTVAYHWQNYPEPHP
jgi:hypothetical protein